MSRGSGDGFLRCSDGHVRWGRHGAAGVVFVVGAGDEAVVMLQKRSALSHEGGSWSCAGGALDGDESALDGGLREAAEEIGKIPESFEVLGNVVFAPAADWTYTTFVIAVEASFGESMNFETDQVEWCRLDDVENRKLHAGFATTWPELRRIITAT